MDKKEEEELKRNINEADEIYEYIQKNHLYKTWMADSERFIGFNFIHTRNLVKHSIILSRLTKWLIGLTVALALFSVAQLILLIIQVINN